MLAPITHRCDGRISRDGGYAPESEKIPCPAFRRADGMIENSIQCGEPCSWIMGKSGHGTPPWETVNGLRRDPGEPDAPPFDPGTESEAHEACPFCPKKFFTAQSLRQHVADKHPRTTHARQS
jgi:hypothetical protein